MLSQLILAIVQRSGNRANRQDKTMTQPAPPIVSVRMKKLAVWTLLIAALAVFALVPATMRASDHADPINLKEPESNLTDLFFFPQGDQMILILCVNRALIKPPPYNLAPFEYAVHFDFHTALNFDSDEDRARYGGKVANPDGLKPDATIKFRLNDNASLKEKSFEGLQNPDRIRVYTGVREDPFNFPRFFNRNTIAMVVGIPMSSFPAGQRDFILWGTTYKDGKQVDHVGRSNRTQQSRFDALNVLPPNEHVPEIMRQMKKWNDIYTTLNGFREPYPKALAGLIQLVLQIRKYDVVPDVMIYTNRLPAQFPNGRQLLDDVAAQTCATGDCILQELSFIEGSWPRRTANDKPFLPDWPYLAEPYPEQTQMPPSMPSVWPYIIAIALANLIISWLIVELVLWLFRLAFRRKRARLAT
jgi:hypothetical protein